jgi:hypothetical protein
MEQQLHQLLRRSAQVASEIAEIRGELGPEVRAFCEDHGVNKKALTFIAQLDRASEEKRDDVLRSLNMLLPVAQEKWATQNTPDMFDEQDEPEEKAVASTVVEMTQDDPFAA